MGAWEIFELVLLLVNIGSAAWFRNLHSLLGWLSALMLFGLLIS